MKISQKNENCVCCCRAGITETYTRHIFFGPRWWECGTAKHIRNGFWWAKERPREWKLRKQGPSPLQASTRHSRVALTGIFGKKDIDEYPDITYCVGSKAYLTAKKYVGDKYIVFSSVLNWLRIPMTPNTYGISNELHEDMQLMLFRYIFPDIGKIGMIYGRYTAQWFEKVRNKAKEMEMNIIGQDISETRGSFSAFDKLPKDIAAFWLISDPEITLDKKGLAGILKACDAKKIPVFSYHDAFARLGGVLILSVDDSTIGRQAAAIAMKLGSGRRPGQKVQPPAGSRIILNMKKVRLYGISYNEDALEAINTIIE